MSDVACVSCKKKFDPLKMKLFMEIIVCEGCHAAAAAAVMKLDREIKQLRFVAREAVRMGVIDGAFADGGQMTESTPTQKSILETVLKLKQYAAQQKGEDDGTDPR